MFLWSDCSFHFTCLGFTDWRSQSQYCRNVILHWHRSITCSIYLQRAHTICRMGSTDFHQLSLGPSARVHLGVCWVCKGVGTARSCATHSRAGEFPYSLSRARKRGQGHCRPCPTCHWHIITNTSMSSNTLIGQPAFPCNLQPLGSLKIFLNGKIYFKSNYKCHANQDLQCLEVQNKE